jgi:hypothetical protein
MLPPKGGAIGGSGVVILDTCGGGSRGGFRPGCSLSPVALSPGRESGEPSGPGDPKTLWEIPLPGRRRTIFPNILFYIIFYINLLYRNPFPPGKR